MEILKISEHKLDIRFNMDDLRILNNACNEVGNGFYLDDFKKNRC
jgi:hypothetical protein